MEIYRVQEVKMSDSGGDSIKLQPLREYERQSSDQAGLIEQVRHFFEMEMSSPKALEVVDFDALIIINSSGAEIAHFSVPDFWIREWKDVAPAAVNTHLTEGESASPT